MTENGVDATPSSPTLMSLNSILAKFREMLSDGRSPPELIEKPDTPVSKHVTCRYSELSWSARVNENSTFVFNLPSSESRHRCRLAGSSNFDTVISDTDA